jgi:hypothetical protein
VVPLDMPELKSDSESSDSDDVQIPAHAPRSSVISVATVAKETPALVSDSCTSDSGPDHNPAPRRMPTPQDAKKHNTAFSARDHSIVNRQVRRAPVSNQIQDPNTDDDAHIAAFLAAMDSSNSDTSDVEAEARAAMQPSICSAHPVEDDLLPPPRFVGFVKPPSSTGPPQEHQAIICAVDTMCQGSHSIISEKLVQDLYLPMRPFTKTCRKRTARASHAHTPPTSTLQFVSEMLGFLFRYPLWFGPPPLNLSSCTTSLHWRLV